MKYLIFAVVAVAVMAADITLGVKYYAEIGNPDGIPGAWPAEVRELHNAQEAADAQASGLHLMTLDEYVSYRAAHQGEYDAWAGSFDNPRFGKRLAEDVSAEAEKRITAMFGEDAEKAKTRQQQLQARFSELTLLAVDAGGVANLSTNDQAEVAALRTIWAKVKAIRVAEFGKTNSIAGKTNVSVTAGWPQ